MTSRKPKAPDGLGTRGAALWRSTVAAFELRPDELATLLELCRTVDVCDRLEAELRDAPLTVAGSTPGSVRPHPLLAELRGARQVLAQLSRLLGLSDIPDDGDGDEPAPLTPKQARAQHAARVRWDRERQARQRYKERRGSATPA